MNSATGGSAGAARTRPHAIVIGSGFGGLAAAVRLGARGYRVTVVERLDAPGGRAYVHRQDGFTFDAGPTIVTAPFLLRELWELVGRNFDEEIDLRLMEPFYRVLFEDGSRFDYNGDEKRLREEVARLSPQDVAGLEHYSAISREIFRVGFEQLSNQPFSHFSDMVRVLPDLIRLQSYRSVHGMVSRFVRDPRLQQVLSFHPLLIGGNPFSVTSVYCLIEYLEQHWGVHYVMGGTGRLITGLVDLIAEQGGEIRYHADVTGITVADGQATGVDLADGEHIAADIVVSNADAAWTYRHLVPAAARRRWTNRRLERARYSMGLFVWYFGTHRQYPDVEHHTILMGPRYRELLEDIFKRKVLADDFSLYLHRPTATDPSVAPAGCDTFYALSPVPHLDADVDWQERAEPYRQAIADYLQEKLLPGLDTAQATSLVATPLDFFHRLKAYRGSGFSLEPVLHQSAWFRPHNRSEEVRHLYLVGAGTHPGAGLPGVLSSARILDRVVPDAEFFT
ncbi:phytoene dehydrogenase [Halorhodospira abdelmalekii]|uniref:phytoene desaturase n=1 Tax=Halorhodospira abdelmalekii TaxID=421629 RepID=UPI00190669F5|nr:phytoene dehydrogenase [Halorhodospira abdelmalekii]